MADVYTPPPDGSYLLNTPFDMPTNGGTIWAIAFSNTNASILTAALSVTITVIFVLLWNLTCFIAVSFPGRTTRRRYAALVALWNSNDSWFAARELASYAYHYFSFSSGDFWYGFGFAITAFVFYSGSLALGIVGPSLVQVGNVAPVRPSQVYYPKTAQGTDPGGILKEFGLRAPGVLRALGSVEAAKVTKREKVDLDNNDHYGLWKNKEPIHQLKYSYSITGTELGLQHGADLKSTVTGSCITEYGWYAENSSDTSDLYKLWGLVDYPVPIDEYNIQTAPKADFQKHPDALEQFRKDGNVSFAIIPWSAHRASISQGSDPWYATEPGNASYNVPFEAEFWMQRARPVLSCWQQDSWSYGSQQLNSISDINGISGIKVSRPLLAVLKAAFTFPVLIRLGDASGDSALRSRTTSPNGVIDARASSIESDLERLLVATYVATRNTLVDATMFQSDGTWGNILEGSNGQPADGAGDFVVASPNIQTFSLIGLITPAVILGALVFIQLALSWSIRRNHGYTGGEPGNSSTKRWLRFKALSAVQLFRRIYEPERGKLDGHWRCTSHFPLDQDAAEFKLAGCNDQQASCMGHIEGRPTQTQPARNLSPADSADNP